MRRNHFKWRLALTLLLSLVFACSCGGTRKNDSTTVDDLGIVMENPYEEQVIELSRQKALQDSIIAAQNDIIRNKEAAILLQQQKMQDSEINAITREYEREKAYLEERIKMLEQKQKISQRQSPANWEYYQDQGKEIEALKATLDDFKNNRITQDIRTSIEAVNAKLASLEAQNKILIERQPSAEEIVTYREYVDKTYFNVVLGTRVHYVWLTDREASELFPDKYLAKYNRLRDANKLNIANTLDVVLRMYEKQDNE